MYAYTSRSESVFYTGVGYCLFVTWAYQSLLSDKLTTPHFLFFHTPCLSRSRKDAKIFFIMKKVICTVLAFLVCAGMPLWGHGLHSGQPVQVRLTSPIDTKTAKKKTPIQVSAIVEQDVRAESSDVILIRRGTPIELDAQIVRAKGVGKPGSVFLRCLSTQAVDGQHINLQGTLEQNGANRKGTALGVGLGVGLTVCWPCLFCLCIKGEQVVIPENTMIHNVVVNGNYSIATTNE